MSGETTMFPARGDASTLQGTTLPLGQRQAGIARRLKDGPAVASRRRLDVGASETPRTGGPPTGRGVADDGRYGRLTLCTEATVVAAVLLDPVRAAALAARLIAAALPKLGT